MNVQITWHGEQFNVELTSKDGQDPFLSVRGCRIVDGQKGAFVSYPATKNEKTGKWWAHVWASDKFNAVVLEKALSTRPASGSGRQARDGDAPF